MRTSQLSMFVTVGIMILITIGFAFSVVSYISGRQASRDEKLATNSANTKKIVESYVNTCAEREFLNALRLLGKQGGVIYKNQGGNYEIQLSDMNVKYIADSSTGINILYAITLPTTINIVDYFNPDYPYPWVCFPYLDVSGGKSKNMNDACDFDEGKKSFESIDFGSSVLVPLKRNDGTNSIQETLETYLNNNISKCLDFEPLEKQGLKVIPGTVQTSINILPDSVVLTINMPTTIIRPRTNEEFHINTYTLNQGIRIGRVYGIISDMVNRDITDISYNIMDISGLTGYDTSIESEIKRDVNDNLHDDIIRVKDKASKIDDGYVFAFARKDRRPALHYIKEFTKTVIGESTPMQFSDFRLGPSETNEPLDPDEDTFVQNNYLFLPEITTEISPGEVQEFKVYVTDIVYSDSQTVRVTGVNG